MKRNLLQSYDEDLVREYVCRKIKRFNSWRYTSAERDEKCIEYFLAANDMAKGIIKQVYWGYAKKEFPEAAANEALAAKVAEDSKKFLRMDKLEELEDEAEQLQATLITLRQWKTARKFEGGEGFFQELQQIMSQLEDGQGSVDTNNFETDFRAYLNHELTHSAEHTNTSASAEFEAMLGFQQTAGLTFDAKSAQWGTVTGSVNEKFKFGAWATGSVEAELKKTGFNAEMLAKLVVGAQLKVEGECTWKPGQDVGLKLAGDVTMFAGGKADVEAFLSVHAIKGISAGLAAGAFAGFKVEAEGNCSFLYGKQPLVKATASAGFTFGVGAQFEAGFKTSIFGPTTFNYSTSLTKGVGVSHSAAIAINFNGCFLAGKNEFRKAVYFVEVMAGIKGTSKQDKTIVRNHFYLCRCIERVNDAITETNTGVKAMTSNTPLAKPSKTSKRDYETV